MSQVMMTPDQVRQLAGGKRRTGSKRADARRRFMAELPTSTEAERQPQRGLFELHDEAAWTIRLPLPPSVNHYWRAFVRPGSNHATQIISADGRAYKDAVAALWRAHWKGCPPEALTGRLRLSVSVCYFNATKIDLDNRIKPLQDALTDCHAWTDDSQIDDLRAIRGPVVAKPGYMDVIIETISES